MYIHQQRAWPRFTWDAARLSSPLAALRHDQGLLLGRLLALGFPLRAQAGLETLASDVLKSSEIEGEHLHVEEVRSSLARRLGVDIGALRPSDRTVDGVVDMLLDATHRYDQPLTAARLFHWHALLFPPSPGSLRRVRRGAWRRASDGPMQIVSGPHGRERIHFEAPPAARVPAEMQAFLDWFESTPVEPVLKAGLAHLRFVTIHPFSDGNGRIARAIADLALSRSERSPLRFYSLSAQIRAERADYYTRLERAQRGSLDVTAWLDWFLACLHRAILGASVTLDAVLGKARFWNAAAPHPLNPRQRLVLNRLLDGFEGHLTSTKWAALAKCSQDTALRDIQELIAWGLLARTPAGGRSTAYLPVIPPA